MYEYYNANVNDNHTNDCVVRAISVAEGKSWDETYEELSDIAQRHGILLDDVEFVEPLLDYRYKRCCYMNKKVGDFAKTHPYHVYIISLNGHLTCSFYGTIIDTFDCRNSIMKCAWRVR